jgi:hypothetical protein
VTSEKIPSDDAEQAIAEAEGEDTEETDPEDDYHLATPSKPSHHYKKLINVRGFY